MYQLEQLETFLQEKKKTSPETLRAEQKRIERQLLEYVYSDRTSEKLQMFVRQHAKGLIAIMDSDPENKKPEIISVAQELLLFLEKHAGMNWDNHLIVPELIKRPIIEVMKISLPIARAKVMQLNIEPPFEPLLFSDIEKLLVKPDLENGQLYMLRAVMAALMELPDITEDADGAILAEGNRQLRDILCRYNVNSLAVYGYATAKLKKEEDELGDEAALFRLMRRQQLFESIKVEPGYYYQPHRPALTDMLVAYLQDRITIKERELLPVDKTGAPVGPDSQKVNTSLTVEKLGFFLRLFVDTYVFRVHNWKGLCRFMATYVVTVGRKDQREAASDGLYTNMYSPTMKTVVSVIDILERMLKRAIQWKNALKNTGKPPAKVDD